ncbi:MAG: hypothetical protein WB992_19315 [Bryobacteraceae bacterium]
MCRYKNFAAVLGLAIINTSFVAGQAPVPPKLADGTSVRLVLREPLSSATAQSGQVVHFEVADDVRSANFIAIPRGAPAEGHVVTAEPKKRMGRAGRLDFAIDYIHLPDGNNVKVRATSTQQGKDKSGAVIAGTLLVSPLFLLMHGKDVNVPSGTAITAFIDGSYTLLQPASNQAATGSLAPQTALQQTAPGPQE